MSSCKREPIRVEARGLSASAAPPPAPPPPHIHKFIPPHSRNWLWFLPQITSNKITWFNTCVKLGAVQKSWSSTISVNCACCFAQNNKKNEKKKLIGAIHIRGRHVVVDLFRNTSNMKYLMWNCIYYHYSVITSERLPANQKINFELASTRTHFQGH